MGEVEVQYFDGLKDVVPKVALQVLSLNEILAEVVFHDGRSGEPAHFDLDDKVKSALESRIGLEPNEFDSHIARLVCGVAKDKSPESVFRLFSQATKRSEVRLPSGTRTLDRTQSIPFAANSVSHHPSWHELLRGRQSSKGGRPRSC